MYALEAAVFENDELTSQEVQAAESLATRLGSRVDDPVLDLASGPGRHGRRLVQGGSDVLAVDHSFGLLTSAPSRAAELRRVCADLRALPLAEAAFRSILLLGKGFGYFEDSVNEAILRSAHRLLRPGGFLCVEMPDRDRYLATLPESETVDRRLDGDVLVRSTWKSRWDRHSRRLEVDERHVVVADRSTFWSGVWDVRLYDAGEIEEVLRRVGFRKVASDAVRLVEVEGARSEVLFVGAIG